MSPPDQIPTMTMTPTMPVPSSISQPLASTQDAPRPVVPPSPGDVSNVSQLSMSKSTAPMPSLSVSGQSQMPSSSAPQNQVLGASQVNAMGMTNGTSNLSTIPSPVGKPIGQQPPNMGQMGQLPNPPFSQQSSQPPQQMGQQQQMSQMPQQTQQVNTTGMANGASNLSTIPSPAGKPIGCLLYTSPSPRDS